MQLDACSCSRGCLCAALCSYLYTYTTTCRLVKLREAYSRVKCRA
jgi:hypothetical protein